jgi:hypothetical protein
MPFSIAQVVNDPAFAQSFTITRSKGGQFKLGRWINATQTVASWGSIQPPSPEELEMVPEGDRVTGMIVIHSSQPIYETNVNLTNGISDLVTWHDNQYRVMKVLPWQDYGYWKALAVRMSGQ